MQPIRVDQLLAATGGWAIRFPSTLLGFERLVTDSRNVRAGDLFWALKGDTHDGHDFIDEAARRGAAAGLVELAKIDSSPLPLIAVENTLAALHRFAARHREQQDALVIGVTGSVGKTTTRHLIHSVLCQRHTGEQSPRNFNNHIGVPLSLLEIEQQHEFAVVELAASQVGEIRRLCEIAQPEAGVLTRIAPAHLSQFGDLRNICRAKGELLEALPKTGFAVLNGDDELVRGLASRAACRTILVGERLHNDLVAGRIRTDNGLLRFRVDGTEFALTALGSHHLTAALAAIAIAREVGIDDEDTIDALSRFEPVPGRCQPRPIGDWLVIDDTYNASPASMHAACEVLRHWKQANQRILIAGDMLELGRESDTYHRQLGEQIAHAGIDRLLLSGRHAPHVAAAARAAGMDPGRIGICDSTETRNTLLDLWLEPDDVILVKGSRAMQMERVIEQIEKLVTARRVDPPFPHRAVA